MTTPEEFAPADTAPAPAAAPIAPAKKSHKAKPKPSLPPTASRLPLSDSAPIGRPDFGHKDPDVIRWHLARHPERMEEIYGSFDWRKLLSLHPEATSTLDD